MVTVSLCMIVKNEEAVLASCLQSVQGLVEEIIVVDTGSTDKTKEVARRFTPHVLDFAWVNDFSAARNYSFSQAAMDYILWLDADDVFMPADREKIKNLKQTLSPEVDVVYLPYHIAFDKEGRPTFTYYRERLVKRERGFRWQEPVHEYLAAGGNTLRGSAAVTHKKPPGRPSGRNLAIYESQMAKGEPLSPRGQYYFARELKDAGEFSRAAHQFSVFLQGGQGWVEDNITACLELSRCYKAIKAPAKQLEALLASFAYDLPRAEIVCELGYYYKAKGDFARSAFWFELALSLPKPEHAGFVLEDCWGYLPAIELAVCYDRLGKRGQAAAFNERAAQFKPNDLSVLYNREYFTKENPQK